MREEAEGLVVKPTYWDIREVLATHQNPDGFQRGRESHKVFLTCCLSKAIANNN